MTQNPPPAALASAAAFAPPLPRFAQIEPVGRCNLQCRMCTVNHRGDAVAELPLERYVAWLDEMPQLAELHLQGLGEPMLHPRFFEMVEIAVARGIRVSANTNLTLLTHERARRCAASGLAELSVSLDGASAPVYEAVRHGASFEKVLRNLDRLVAARDAALGRAGGARRAGADAGEPARGAGAGAAAARARRRRTAGAATLERPRARGRRAALLAYPRLRPRCRTRPAGHGRGGGASTRRALAGSLGFTLHLPRLAAPGEVPAGARLFVAVGAAVPDGSGRTAAVLHGGDRRPRELRPRRRRARRAGRGLAGAGCARLPRRARRRHAAVGLPLLRAVRGRF
ncbi:MAG: radical SAM protein [Comamonadaceae bacterium]|nr:radical SAM protein [Comamonadaceae bacterium]